MQLIKRFWSDEAGFVVSAELALVATLLVIGMVVGLSTIRDSVTNELADTAGAIDDINQSYSTEGIQGHSAAVAGFNFVDSTDYCDDDDDQSATQADQCVLVAAAATPSTASEASGAVVGSNIGN